MTTRLNLEAIEQEVRSFLKASQGQGSTPIETVAVQEERTEKGDDILIVNITFAPSEQPLDPDQLADIPFRLGQQLEAAGEQRFCHVRIHFAEKQALRGW
jgi:hypothetical protein